MDFRNQVKNVLRMCGHAAVSTVHDRLNGIEYLLQQIIEQNTHIASTQTALLQSGVHLVEGLQGLKSAVEQMRERSAGKEDIQALLDQLGASQEILAQNTDTAGTQTALLQSAVHLVGNVSQLQTTLEGMETRIAAQVREYCATRADTHALAAAQSGIETMLGLSGAMRDAAAASLAVLEPAAHATSEFLANQSVRQVCVETSDYFFTNPELGLLAFLYSYLPSRTAVDVGAHIGEVSEHLLSTGYEVYAFEPYPESYRRLTERLAGRPDFHAFNLALGSVTGELPLYTVRDRSPEMRYEDTTVFHSLAPHGMPADLSFESAVPVPIRKLSQLHREGLIPEDPSLLKIDTEGYDLEVVRGMEDLRYPVVMVEFWDGGIPFAPQGLLYTAESMVREMRQRGYMWYLVIYRVWGRNETAFYCNQDRSVPGSWGNIVFFQNREVFAQAQQWCSAVLPRTYFKHVAASTEKPSKDVEAG